MHGEQLSVVPHTLDTGIPGNCTPELLGSPGLACLEVASVGKEGSLRGGCSLLNHLLCPWLTHSQ